MMKYSEQFMEHIEYTFAAFCNVVLRNAAINAYRDFGRKKKREVSLEYLISETSLEPFTLDSYFEQHDKPTVFVVKGQAVIVESDFIDFFFSFSSSCYKLKCFDNFKHTRDCIISLSVNTVL